MSACNRNGSKADDPVCCALAAARSRYTGKLELKRMCARRACAALGVSVVQDSCESFR